MCYVQNERPQRLCSDILTLVTSVGRHWRRVNGSAFAFFISATSRLLASTAYSKFRRRFRWFIALHSQRHSASLRNYQEKNH